MKTDIESWHPWFAWHPVRVDLDEQGSFKQWALWKLLERRYVFVWGCDSYFRYRFLKHEKIA